MSYLSKIVNKREEDLATETLIYLVNNVSEFQQLLLKHILSDEITSENSMNWETQKCIDVQKNNDNGKGFLDAYADNDKVTIIVEAKFNAFLTDNQPVGYLNFLVKQINSSKIGYLVVLAPERRTHELVHKFENRISAVKACNERTYNLKTIEENRKYRINDNIYLIYLNWQSIKSILYCIKGKYEYLAEELKMFIDKKIKEQAGYTKCNMNVEIAETISKIYLTINKTSEILKAEPYNMKPRIKNKDLMWYGIEFNDVGCWFGYSNKFWTESGGTPLMLKFETGISFELIDKYISSYGNVLNGEWKGKPAYHAITIKEDVCIDEVALSCAKQVHQIYSNIKSLHSGN